MGFARNRRNPETDPIDFRRHLVLQHRMQGGFLDDAFGQYLADEYGLISPKTGKPYKARTLNQDYQIIARERVAEVRDNFPEYQQLQLERLEELLDNQEVLYKETYDDTENKWRTSQLMKIDELRLKVIAEISTLIGANAPVEIMVHQGIEETFSDLIKILRDGLTEAEFKKVADLIAITAGKANTRLVREEEERKQLMESYIEVEAEDA